MADKEWITIQPSLEPIMAPVLAVIETIDSVLSAIIVILNIVQTVLNIVKVFLVGLLDPIRAIVEAIIEELRNIIHDLRQMGFYLHGDWDLCESPFDELRGGFQAYERRMLKRLLDRRDPNRPDFSSSSAALAVFAYQSPEDVTLMVEFIMRLKAFFGAKSPTSGNLFPPPTTPEIKFGSYSAGLASFKNLGASFGSAPDSMTIEWTMPSTGALFSPGPAGFLIHVSTEPDGFGVQGVKVKAGSTDKVENLPALFPVGINPSTGTALRLYGGVCDLDYNTPDSVYESEQGNKLYLTLGSNSPLIWPSQLEDDIPLGAATYFMKPPAGLALLGPGQTLSTTLQWDQLPKKITAINNGGVKPDIESEDAYTFYVRVRALTKTYVDAGVSLTGTGFAPSIIGNPEIKPYRILSSTLTETTGMILRPLNPAVAVSSTNFGEASEAGIASFPTDSMIDFMEATKAALSLLYLTRSDYTEVIEEDGEQKPARNTYLPGAESGLEGFTDMLAKYGDPMDTLYKNVDAPSFRRKIRKKIAGHTQRFLSQPPPESVCSHIAEVGADLLTFKWSDINSGWPDLTILESMRSNLPLSGIASSPAGIGGLGLNRMRAGRLTTPESLWISRTDVFPLTARGASIATAFPDGAYFNDMGFSDWAPVLYSWTDSSDWGRKTSPLNIAYIRKLLLDYEDGKLLQQAQAVLQVAGATGSRSPSKGEWIAVRFFDQALEPLDGILTDIEKFLLGILDGLQGMIDKIIAYIDAIQARIYQIQALIELIRAILNSLKVFDLPSFSALVLVENGTDGLITGLLTAENKPDNGAAAYGGGVVAIAGGMPTVILEILALLFPPSGGD